MFAAQCQDEFLWYKYLINQNSLRHCSTIGCFKEGNTPALLSQTLDWANALVALNASHLDKDTLEDTLSVLLKHEADLQKAKRQLMAPPPSQQPRKRPPDEFGRFSGN